MQNHVIHPQVEQNISSYRQGSAESVAATDQGVSNAAFVFADHVLARLPEVVRAKLNEDDRAALARALKMPEAQHLVDFRASTRIFNKRHYVRLMVGEEKRNVDRLRQEKQISLVKTLMLIAVIGWALTTLTVVVGGVILYLLKSLAGVDIFDGPSFLHALFFD